jgi:hypothetical protein
LNLELHMQLIEHYPAPVGAHGLAWSYLLDNLFADAYAHNVTTMTVVLPHQGLVALCERRAHLSAQAALPHAGGTALAQFAPTNAFGELRVDRFYSLEHGLLAPRHLRTDQVKRTNWQLDAQLFVLTWQVKLWGAAMKLLNQAQRPQLADRATFAMRRYFASATPTPSFYILRGWSPNALAEEGMLATDTSSLTPSKIPSEHLLPDADVAKIHGTNADNLNTNSLSTNSPGIDDFSTNGLSIDSLSTTSALDDVIKLKDAVEVPDDK